MGTSHLPLQKLDLGLDADRDLLAQVPIAQQLPHARDRAVDLSPVA
jgi:hypothetical protein